MEGTVRRTPDPRYALTGAVLLSLLVSGSLSAQEPHRRILAEKLTAELTRVAADADGVVGIAVVDLESGERFGVNADLIFPQGSAIKIPVLLELFRQSDEGRLRLDERLPVTAEAQVGGSGVIRHFGDGTSALSLRDLAVLMITLSDNTATNLLIERVGMDAVNRTMRELGLDSIRVQRTMIRPDQSAAGNENLATAAQAATLMARLHRCELPLTAASCAGAREILEIPKSGALTRPIPGSIDVAWKPGGIEGVSTAWGLVHLPTRPYALAIMVNYSNGGAGQSIEAASRAVWSYFSRIARSTPYGARVPMEVWRPPPPR